MRKFLRISSKSMCLLSIVSVLSLGSYMLVKLMLKLQKSNSDSKEMFIDNSGSASSDLTKAHGSYLPDQEPVTNQDAGVSIEPQPANGTIFVIPETACVAPLTVEVTGSGSYFIYLKFLRYPENVVFTAVSSTNAGRSDVGFFVAADSKVSLSVPAGVYRLTYASGKDWRGIQEKFGPDTKYYEANRTLTFYQENNRLYGNTIQLFPQSDGNASFHQLDPSDFPG